MTYKEKLQKEHPDLAEVYEELSNDIFAYAKSKLPDADADALTDIICYVLRKTPYLIGEVIKHKNKSYMAILIEQAGKEILEND